VRVGVRTRDVRPRDHRIRIGADLDADVSPHISAGRVTESEEGKAAVDAGGHVMLAVLRGVRQADLKGPGLLRLANGRAGRLRVGEHEVPYDQHQTRDNGGHPTMHRSILEAAMASSGTFP